MKITKHELGHGVFLEPTSELETFLTWDQVEELYNLIDKLVWERDWRSSAKYQAGFSKDHVI